MRLLRRLQKEGIDISSAQVRIIIIYTADVTRSQTQDALTAGDITISTTEAFLLEIASEEVKARIRKKIQEKQPMDERDLMELIVLPLTYKGKQNQRTAAQEAVFLAKEIEDETMQEMALAGILSFSDKIIDKKLANEIRRCLSMTKVGAIIAKEMEESEEKGRQKGIREGICAFVLDNLEENVPEERIVQKLQLRFRLPKATAEEYVAGYAKTGADK